MLRESLLGQVKADLDAKVAERAAKETARKARRDARYPLPPGVYLIGAIALAAAILFAGLPAFVDVLLGLLIAFSLVSSYKAGERFMEGQVARGRGGSWS